MSGIALEWAISQDLRCGEKIVLCALASFHSQQSPHPYPSRELLANVAGVSVKHIGRVIPKLEKRGLIRVKHSSGWHSNRYELQLEQSHRVPVNEDTVALFPPYNKDTEPSEQGLPVQTTGTQSPTNKVINKVTNKKEGADTPNPASPAVTEETIWGIGEGLGVPRNVIGKAVSKSGKAKVAEILARMVVDRPVEPTSYLMAAVSQHNESDDFMVGAI